MPLMVTVRFNPKWKPGPNTPEGQKLGFNETVASSDIRLRQDRRFPIIAARELVRGAPFYEIVQDTAKSTVNLRKLEDMSDDELKLAMASYGIKPDGKMKRATVVAKIREKMAEVEFVDDDA